MTTTKGIWPGIAVSCAVATFSVMASYIHPSFDPLVISIIFGMLVSNIIGSREGLDPGLDVVIKWALPVGIALYGLQLEFRAVDRQHLLAALLAFAAMFLATYLICRGIGLGGRLPLLIGIGMSVCGASAIAIVSPLLRARREDISMSLLSIMVVGLTGMVFMKFGFEFMELPAESYAFLVGAALPMFGQVKVAASSMGAELYTLAVSVKLIRISMILPVSLAIMAYAKAGKEDSGAIKIKGMPWFIAAFLGLALLGNSTEWAAIIRPSMEPVSRMGLALALGAIGLSIDFDSVTTRGGMPVAAAALGWVVATSSIYLALSVIR